MKKILLAGEPMGLFISQEEGPLESVSNFSAAVAGAEFNVAVGLTRLGHQAHYLTRLGDDPFGRRILNTMKANGIDTALIQMDSQRSTGFMLKGKTSHGDPAIHYFRKNSAASALSIKEVETLDFSAFDILHMTGIFPPLSSSTMEAAEWMMKKAREAGLTVFFDPNLRPALWPDTQTMVDCLNRLAGLADYMLPGYKEGEILMGSRDPEKIADYYLEKGAKAVIVKTGAKGAFAASRQERIQVPTYQEREIVDTVGAGDGFACGIISGIAEGLSLRETVLRANAIGTIQIMSVGDNEGLPTREQLDDFMAHTPLKQA